MTSERIADLKLHQESLLSFAGEAGPPEVLILADEEAVLIRGNEAGLVRLAREILEVSSGGQINLAASEWIKAPLLPLEGIVLDPDPKFELKDPTLLNKLGAYSILAIIVTVFAVGVIASLSWVVALFHR